MSALTIAQIAALARAATEMGEPSVEISVDGHRVTIHALPKPESPLTRQQLRLLLKATTLFRPIKPCRN